MKRVLLIYLCILISTCMQAQHAEKLYIFHTNDTHSTIDPVSVNDADTALAGKGGFVRRAALIRQLREKCGENNMLLFDSGDFSQGSPYYNVFKGEAEIDLMNAMGYDACTIGNHEFDYGLENMARIFRKASFPVVCSNYCFKNTPLEDVVRPYVILHRGGLKIGVLGVGPELRGLVYEEFYGNVTYMEPVKVVNKIASFLKTKKHCDLVICLSHLGWQGSVSDETLIANTRNIDMVLGGHTHSYFDKPLFYKNLDGKMIPLQQMGKYGRFLGWITLDFEKK